VREQMPAKLVMIGDGPDRGAAEYLVRKKKLSKDVFFLGKQDRVYDILGVGDLFLLPSDSESFGLAALEAMACEVPVLASNVGGIPEVVTHGVDGYLFEPRDVETASQFALEILSRPDHGRAMGEMSRVNARRRYCSNDIIPRYEAFYEKILSAANAPALAAS
jgi:L-malate glycosyltransferase